MPLSEDPKIYLVIKSKDKMFTLEQAVKAHRGSRGIPQGEQRYTIGRAEAYHRGSRGIP